MSIRQPVVGGDYNAWGPVLLGYIGSTLFTTAAGAGSLPTATLNSPEWAIGADGKGYWLNGNTVPSGYTAAVLGSDLKLYPIGGPA